MVEQVSRSRPPHGRHGKGPSSFWMHDPDLVFASLGLKEGDRFLDLGCGPGDYSLRASREVGPSGLVFALDRGREALDKVWEKMAAENRSNIRVIEADLTATLPLPRDSVDLCLLATVLHIHRIRTAELSLFDEIHRVLRTGGRFAVIECKKEEQDFGPPIHLRLSPEEVEEAVRKHGFRQCGLVDLGYNYLIQFTAL